MKRGADGVREGGAGGCTVVVIEAASVLLDGRRAVERAEVARRAIQKASLVQDIGHAVAYATGASTLSFVGDDIEHKKHTNNARSIAANLNVRSRHQLVKRWCCSGRIFLLSLLLNEIIGLHCVEEPMR